MEKSRCGLFMRFLLPLFMGIFYAWVLPASDTEAPEDDKETNIPEEIDLKNGYSLLTKKFLGEGTFARVYAGKCTHSNASVAVKIIVLDEVEGNAVTTNDGAAGVKSPISISGCGAKDARKGAMREIKALRKLQEHANIVKLHAVLQFSDVMLLVMEYAHGSTLKDIMSSVGALSEDVARPIFWQIGSAIAYCHTKLIAHHDIKPANIVVDETNVKVKILDFGLCIRGIKAGKKCRNGSGTPYYSSLQVLEGKRYDPYLADVWSFGVILYETLTGEMPWWAEDYDDLVDSISTTNPKLPKTLSGKIECLITNILCKDPAKRFNMAKVLTDSWWKAGSASKNAH